MRSKSQRQSPQLSKRVQPDSVFIQTTCRSYQLWQFDRRGQKNFNQTIAEIIEVYGDDVTDHFNKGNFVFVYKYDFASIYKFFPLNATAFAGRIKMNPSLIRQYKSGITNASDKQKKKIEEVASTVTGNFLW